MFDVGGGEIIVIGIVALLVVGPKELPGLLRAGGAAMNKVRRMAGEFRAQFDEAMREAEVDQAKKAFTDMNDTVQAAKPTFNPMDTIRNEIKSAKDELAGVTHSRDGAAAPAPEVKVTPPEPPLNITGLDAPSVAAPPDEPVAEPAPKPKRTRKAKSDESGSAA
jgi:sec-independent protein translocase protein TatB